jgi:hypothetical protein
MPTNEENRATAEAFDSLAAISANSVVQLKVFLRAVNLPHNGLKADLVDRLWTHIQQLPLPPPPPEQQPLPFGALPALEDNVLIPPVDPAGIRITPAQYHQYQLFLLNQAVPAAPVAPAGYAPMRGPHAAARAPMGVPPVPGYPLPHAGFGQIRPLPAAAAMAPQFQDAPFHADFDLMAPPQVHGLLPYHANLGPPGTASVADSALFDDNEQFYGPLELVMPAARIMTTLELDVRQFYETTLFSEVVAPPHANTTQPAILSSTLTAIFTPPEHGGKTANDFAATSLGQCMTTYALNMNASPAYSDKLVVFPPVPVQLAQYFLLPASGLLPNSGEAQLSQLTSFVTVFTFLKPDITGDDFQNSKFDTFSNTRASTFNTRLLKTTTSTTPKQLVYTGGLQDTLEHLIILVANLRCFCSFWVAPHSPPPALIKFLDAYLLVISDTTVGQRITTLVASTPHLIHVMAMDLQATFSAFVAVGQAVGARNNSMVRQSALMSTETTMRNLSLFVNTTHCQTLAPPRSYYLFCSDPTTPAAGSPSQAPHPSNQRKRRAAEPTGPAPAPVPNSRSTLGHGSRSNPGYGPRSNAPLDVRRAEIKEIGFIKYLCEPRDVMTVCPLPRGFTQRFCFAFSSLGMSCREPNTCQNTHIAHFRNLAHDSDKASLIAWQATHPTAVTLIGPLTRGNNPE